MIRLFLIAGLTIFFWSKTLRTETPIENLLKKIDKKYKEIKVIKFDFTQKIVFKTVEEERKIQGEAIIKKPDKFYLRQTYPSEEIIVSDGKKIWFYLVKYKQVIIQEVKSLTQEFGFSRGVIDFFISVKQWKKDYSLKFEGKLENEYLIELEPKENKEFGMIRLWIQDKTYLPHKIELSSEGILMVSQLKNFKINLKKKDEFFKFKIPKGVEKIDK